MFLQHLPTGTDWGEEAFSKSIALAATLKHYEKQEYSSLDCFRDKING